MASRSRFELSKLGPTGVASEGADRRRNIQIAADTMRRYFSESLACRAIAIVLMFVSRMPFATKKASTSDLIWASVRVESIERTNE